MSSTLTRAIRYGLHDELDELYEFIAEMVVILENAEGGDNAAVLTPDDAWRLLVLFDTVEGRVAVLDSAGGYEHGEPGTVDGKAGIR